MWTAFGTTLGFWKHIAAYSRKAINEIVKKLELETYYCRIFSVINHYAVCIKKVFRNEKTLALVIV